MSDLIFILTYACNLNCSYCPVRKGNAALGSDLALKTLALFRDDSSLKIKFFGGEPLIEFDLIKTIVANSPKDTSFELTTNATLLDKEKIDFLLKNNFELRISIDGDENTQRIGRGVALDTILSLPKKIIEKSVANMVISPQNVDYFTNNIKYVYSLGFRKFNFLPAFFNTWTKDEILVFKRETKKAADMIRDIKDIEIINKTIYQEKYLFNEGIVVDYNGDIYYDNRIMISDFVKFKDDFKVGNILEISSLKDLKKPKEIEIRNKVNELLDKIHYEFIELL